MAEDIYEPTDRRPLASRQRPFWQKMAVRLAGARVPPNAISIAGMLSGIAAGVCLALTGNCSGPLRRAAWLGAAVTVQLRLIANLLDGMVAMASGRASPIGELYNEIPDRISDAAIFIGAGYAAGGNIAAGFVAAMLAIMTAYIRAVGKAAGVSNLYLGPMAKQHRMFLITIVCVYLGLSPMSWQLFGTGRALMTGALCLIIAGTLITCLRRLNRIAKTLRGNV